MLALRRSPVEPLVIEELRRPFAPIGDLKALLRLTRTLKRLRPDVVHTHLSKAGTLGRVAARLAGVRVVVHTYHGTVFTGYFSRPLSFLFLAVERVLSLLSSALIVISPSQREHISEFGIGRREQTVEIPYGLELDAFRDARPGGLRAELGIPGDVPLIGTVARLVPIKGVDVFLAACAIVNGTRPDARFIVVGDGESFSSLRALAVQLGLEGRVTFAGWRADLPGIYADLDVVALTSHNEGTPISLIEALASGRAVVATAVGGVPDVLSAGEIGVLVPDGQPTAVAEAILGLLADPARRAALGARGRAHAYDTYDVRQHVTRLTGLYMALLRSAGAQPEERTS